MRRLTPIRLHALLFASLFWSSMVRAAPPDPTLTSALFKTFGMLGLVIVCILGLAWLLKRLKVTPDASQQNLTLLETLPLGKNERLCLIKSGDHYLVLGVTPGSIKQIDEIPVDKIEQHDTASTSWQWAQQILHRQ